MFSHCQGDNAGNGQEGANGGLPGKRFAPEAVINAGICGFTKASMGMFGVSYLHEKKWLSIY